MFMMNDDVGLEAKMQAALQPDVGYGHLGVNFACFRPNLAPQ